MARQQRRTAQVAEVRPSVKEVATNLVSKLSGLDGPAWETKVTEIESLCLESQILTQKTLAESLARQATALDLQATSVTLCPDTYWPGLETDLWRATCQVYEVPISAIRLDSTTSCGYHVIDPDGLMQLGHSKDHRPDLAQLKLMAAAAQPTGHVVACDIPPGNVADDPLYVPLIERVRHLLGRRGLLYAGDNKMAALDTRAHIARHQDYYLVPLPQTGEVPELFAAWVDAVVDGLQEVELLYGKDEKGNTTLFGAGYELERTCRWEMGDEVFEWQERVQLVKSLALARRQGEHLEERLRRAEVELRALTPPVGRGRRQFREEGVLREAIVEV
jgi:transposase